MELWPEIDGAVCAEVLEQVKELGLSCVGWLYRPLYDMDEELRAVQMVRNVWGIQALCHTWSAIHKMWLEGGLDGHRIDDAVLHVPQMPLIDAVDREARALARKLGQPELPKIDHLQLARILDFAAFDLQDDEGASFKQKDALFLWVACNQHRFRETVWRSLETDCNLATMEPWLNLILRALYEGRDGALQFGIRRHTTNGIDQALAAAGLKRA